MSDKIVKMEKKALPQVFRLHWNWIWKLPMKMISVS